MLKKLWSTTGETIKFVIITLLVVVPFRAYIAQPFIVSGASMSPAFQNNEYLIIDEVSYLFRPPRRGEVVVFRYPKNPSKHFIKRIIGLPGETVMIKGDGVFAQSNGELKKLDEPYAAGRFGDDLEITLGPEQYFVMGDNRQVSLDSRSWGPLPQEFITGRALIRLFPPSRAALLP